MIQSFLINFDIWLENLGMHELLAEIIRNLLVVVVLILLAYAADIITRSLILRTLRIITKKTKSLWDDVLYEKRVFHKLSHLAPALVFYGLTPVVFNEYDVWERVIQSLTQMYMIFLIMMVISTFLNALNEIYQQYEISRVKAIKGYLQVGKIVVYVVGGIMIIAVLINRSPTMLFTGLGAFAAVLLLIFKDTILSLVGSIQISANDMIRPGDWISMPSYGADGAVIDIGLTTVKVQNWNKTISTIPTYSLVTDSFQNWRGMEESGGRRIKRYLNIDMESISFCTEEMLDRFRKIQLITKFINDKEKELEEFNKSNNIDATVEVNGRRQTNIGIFRAYIIAYLHNNPNINDDMTFLIRQLQPEATGLPLEIYVFSKVQEWAEYEAIQSDIFDHIIAATGKFDLRIFQNPTGANFNKLVKNLQ